VRRLSAFFAGYEGRCPHRERIMPRSRRYFIEDLPLHVIQRGNNRAVIFHCDDDYVRYRGWLSAAALDFGCALHAYVLMTNHVHLLLTPKGADSMPRMMQSLGRRYVRYLNKVYQRTGTLWEGRYRATPVDGETYFLTCCRYIEMNPVRARMVEHPKGYRWSSYRAHAHGIADTLLTRHAIYDRLGSGEAERQEAYRALFQEPLAETTLSTIRAATNGGWPLGNDRFRQEIAAALKRRVTPRPAGRPPLPRKDGRQIDLF
jgi:putative transposase